MHCHVLDCVVVTSGLLKLHTLRLAVRMEIVTRAYRASQLHFSQVQRCASLLSSFCCTVSVRTSSVVSVMHIHSPLIACSTFYTCVERVCYCVKLESLCDKCFVVTLIMLHLLRRILRRAHMVLQLYHPPFLFTYLLFTCVMFLFWPTLIVGILYQLTALFPYVIG